MTTRSLLLLTLLAATCSCASSLLRQQRGSAVHVNITKPIICRITIINTMFFDNKSNATTIDESLGCVLVVDSVESNTVLPINVPTSIVQHNTHALRLGSLYLTITDAHVTNDGLIFGNHTTFHKLNNNHNILSRHRRLSVKGTHRVMIIRITSLDGISPTSSLNEMRLRLFGTGIGLKSQMKACSFGQLMFEYSSGLEITLPLPMSSYTTRESVETAVDLVIANKYGTNANTMADHIMFCLPPGTGTWAAVANVNYWRSSFNDRWCTSLSATMHELGHNLGMLHSGVGTSAYSDNSGYMGYGDLNPKYPRKCYNGVNNHYLGWYQTRELAVDLTVPNLIQLAAFVDFAKTTSSQFVLLNIGNRYYLQYNRAKLFNIDTQDKADTVTITEDTPNFSTSVAGLAATDIWSVDNYDGMGQTLVVMVCSRYDARSINDADYMVVSIGLNKVYCPPLATISQPSTTIPLAPLTPHDPVCLSKNELCNVNEDCCNTLACLFTNYGGNTKVCT